MERYRSFPWRAGMLAVALAAGAFVAYKMIVADFFTPYVVREAVYAGKLRPGMTKEEVTAMVGSGWKKEKGIADFPRIELWYKHSEYLYFNMENDRLIDWWNSITKETHFSPIEKEYRFYPHKK